jgi:hypothetical protein
MHKYNVGVYPGVNIEKIAAIFNITPSPFSHVEISLPHNI